MNMSHKVNELSRSFKILKKKIYKMDYNKYYFTKNIVIAYMSSVLNLAILEFSSHILVSQVKCHTHN